MPDSKQLLLIGETLLYFGVQYKEIYLTKANAMKIGIIREGKMPADSRVPLTPQQCAKIAAEHQIELVIEPSPNRSYSDTEYQEAGLPLSVDLANCDLLLGVKEVPIDQLIPDKTYCFFSHTIKKQAYNRKLLQAILQKNVTLIDYEVLTDNLGRRLIAFGYFAGMVGAHNGIYTYGERTGLFHLKRMKDCHDYAEAASYYQHIEWPPFKVVLTGTGRVGSGSAKVLGDMGIRKVPPEDFLKKDFEEAVFTQVDVPDYAVRKDGHPFELKDFFNHPEQFQSAFAPYYQQADIMINGIFWDNQAPAFFSKEEMNSPGFRIRVIADVTCDIAPISSIPSTLRASTLANPVFGFNPATGQEEAPHQDKVVDMMTIDNLPSELPRDASKAFGEQFIQHILPEFLTKNSAVLERATIASQGHLGKYFEYLEDYVNLKPQK